MTEWQDRETERSEMITRRGSITSNVTCSVSCRWWKKSKQKYKDKNACSNIRQQNLMLLWMERTWKKLVYLLQLFLVYKVIWAVFVQHNNSITRKIWCTFMFLTLESRIRSAALERLPSLWALLMLATLLPLQADAVPPEQKKISSDLQPGRLLNVWNWAGNWTLRFLIIIHHYSIWTTIVAVTCDGVGGCRARGGTGGADHAAIAAAGSADTAGAGAAVTAPFPALSGTAGPLPGTVLSDVVTYLMTSHGSK